MSKENYGKYRKVKEKFCQVCRLNPAEEVHHIFPQFLEVDHSEENLADVCKVCHMYAPPGDTREEYHELFKYYKKDGGPFINFIRCAYMVMIEKLLNKYEKEKINLLDEIIKDYSVSEALMQEVIDFIIKERQQHYEEL